MTYKRSKVLPNSHFIRWMGRELGGCERKAKCNVSSNHPGGKPRYCCRNMGHAPTMCTFKDAKWQFGANCGKLGHFV